MSYGDFRRSRIDKISMSQNFLIEILRYGSKLLHAISDLGFKRVRFWHIEMNTLYIDGYCMDIVYSCKKTILFYHITIVTYFCVILLIVVWCSYNICISNAFYSIPDTSFFMLPIWISLVSSYLQYLISAICRLLFFTYYLMLTSPAFLIIYR